MNAPAVRADVALVERGLVRSRALAQRLIESGAVDLLDGTRRSAITRVAQPIRADQQLQVRPSPESRFVSRGGAKLDAVLAEVGLDCAGVVALDVGMSTGGFTDCLLARGASRVIGIEVGHGQLDRRLAADARVACLEKTHLRDVTLASLAPAGALPTGFALIVVDLSFISALSVLVHLATLAAPGARLVVLIKPQFELGPGARDGRGIVRAGADIEALRRRAIAEAAAAGWRADDWRVCAIAGGDGNQEYFLVATRT